MCFCCLQNKTWIKMPNWTIFLISSKVFVLITEIFWKTFLQNKWRSVFDVVKDSSFCQNKNETYSFKRSCITSYPLNFLDLPTALKNLGGQTAAFILLSYQEICIVRYLIQGVGNKRSGDPQWLIGYQQFHVLHSIAATPNSL